MPQSPTFTSFIDSLVHLTDYLPLQVMTNRVMNVAEPNAAFVAPPLKLLHSSHDSPAILVLSAPAAVGKSTVAREIAWRTKGPLWTLSNFRLGTGTLYGTLVRAHGPSAVPRLIDDLTAGRFMVILDAIDEGRLQSGEAGFEEFMNEICISFHIPKKSQV